jgi:hypothetical protein
MREWESGLVPGGEPLIIDVQFISAVDRSIVRGFQARIPQLGPARNSSPAKPKF